MNFLFCCEFYYPSVGGVQEVMRQIAERMVLRGHDVTVATTALAAKTVDEWNGVKIKHFGVSGNEARGFVGDIKAYQDFVLTFPADAILIKAAQQWTFDALFPVLADIKTRKVFIPCGFSGLYDPLYQNYFQKLPGILAQFDRLIFYADHYRDIDFCREHKLPNLTFIPNGASEIEFEKTEPSPDFRKRLGIPEDSFVFSTVGSRTGVKGHLEIASAFAQMKTEGKSVTLVLNGNQNIAPKATPVETKPPLSERISLFFNRAIAFLRREGLYRALRRVVGTVLRSCKRTVGIPLPVDPVVEWAERAAKDPLKKVLITDLSRADVVNLFKTTDLFVFASNIEYSPLVLYESAAAGTPFLSVPVGNAKEIAEITGAGMICPAPKDGYGFTRVDPSALAEAMFRAMNEPAKLKKLGKTGRKRWEERFTWDKIASQYETALLPGGAKAGTKRPQISVLLPVYNGGAFLLHAVRSILTQTFSDFELLILDDGSTDGAVDRIREIKDPRLRFMGSPARRGLSARLNEGIDASQGLYIARMDSDDIAFPERLRKEIRFLEANPGIDLVGSRAVVFRSRRDGREEIVGLIPYEEKHDDLCRRPWRGFLLPHPTWLGRASWFRKHRYASPEVFRAEDQDVLLRSYRESRFACLSDVLLAYRKNAFDLKKTLRTRKALLCAQERYFLMRREWKNAALTFFLTLAKVTLDLMAALPGGEKIFFSRMNQPVPQSVRRSFEKAIRMGDS